MLKKILIALFVFILIVAGIGYGYLHSFMPTYEGEIQLPNLSEDVTIYYDNYGIPHIYGNNQEDVYYALGFVHAQERAFQMDLMRRVAQGRLSELVGAATLDTDKLFRTLGIRYAAERAVKKHFATNDQPYQKAARAYLEGVNAAISKNGKTIEHTILGVDLAPFDLTDVYCIGGLMAFGFAEAFKTEPVIEKIAQKAGIDYLDALSLDYPVGATKIPTTVTPSDSSLQAAISFHASTIAEALAKVPAPLWEGSNSWVIAPQKTAAGKTIVANDTHMGYAQPAVWFEAHIEYPETSLYGRYAAAVPFALTGHSPNSAWGLTMFENDDVDFYRERINPDNLQQYWQDDHWETFETRKETIQIKDSTAVSITVRTTKRGPVISDLEAHSLHQKEQAPISIWWAYLHYDIQTFEAFYSLARAKDIKDARKAASQLDVPGLNVMFGDKEGNIAWWASAKLFKRAIPLQTKRLLDGANPLTDSLHYLDFAYNPKAENPKSGFVYSANNQPDSMNGHYVSGYYVPEDRAKAISTALEKENAWTVEKTQQMMFSSQSSVAPSIVQQLVKRIALQQEATETQKQAIAYLKNWDGTHDLQDIAPSIYYKLYYHILKLAMEDELGAKDFKAFLSSHFVKRSWASFIQNDSTLWWDNVKTTEVQETRDMIMKQAFEATIQDLSQHFGEISNWKWENLHTIKHKHAFSGVPLLDRFFSVGVFPMAGGNETINNSGFRLFPNKQGGFDILFGPAMRSIVDFSNLNNSVSVLPTGQSGFFLSPHYDDQAELYNTGKTRKQLIDKQKIMETSKRVLLLVKDSK